jgi:hypothetical protein
LIATGDDPDQATRDAGDAGDAESPALGGNLLDNHPPAESATESIATTSQQAPQSSFTSITSVTASLDRPIVQVNEAFQLREILPDLLAAPALGIDTETTVLDARSNRVRLIQLATPDQTYVVDAFRVDLRPLAPLFANGKRLLVHNAKFDLRFLHEAGITVPSGASVFDTMLGAQLLGAGTPDGRLDQCGLAAVGNAC